MKKFAIAIVALFAVAIGVKACPPVVASFQSSCNVATVQAFAFVPTVQVQTSFVPVTTFQTAFVPVQTQVVQQAVVQQHVVQRQAVVHVQTANVCANVACGAAVKMRGARRSVVRQRQVIRQR